jgi:uncharacterized protein YhdP
VAGQRLAQPLEIADLHRHWAPAHPAVSGRRIRQPDEPLARGSLEELYVSRESAVAGPLPDHHLIDERRRTPWSRLLRRHTATVTANP